MKRRYTDLVSSTLIGLCFSFSMYAQVFETPKIQVRYADGIVTKQTTAGDIVTLNQKDTAQVVDSKEVPLDATALPGGGFATGAESTAVIVAPGAGECRMMPDTQIKVPAKTGSGHSLELLKGKLFIDISAEEIKKRGEASFRLKTPAALLAVKGTQFYVGSSTLQDSFGVHTGSIGVIGTTTRITTNLEQGLVLDVSRKLQISRPMSPEELNSNSNYQWLKALPFVFNSPSFSAKGTVRLIAGKAVVFIHSGYLLGTGKLTAGIDFQLASAIPESERIKAKWTSAVDPNTGKNIESTFHPIGRVLAKNEKIFISEIKMESDLPSADPEKMLSHFWLVIRELYSDEPATPRNKWSNYPFSSQRHLDGSLRPPL